MLPIGVAFALVKGSKPELVVQKLTELGVDRIVPFRAERSVVHWDDAKARKAAARWRAVARAATMQSHRPWLPVVEDVTDLRDLLGREGAALADRRGDPPQLEHSLVLIGPEGGWAPHELDAAACGATSGNPWRSCAASGDGVPHGRRVLLTGLRSGLVGPGS